MVHYASDVAFTPAVKKIQEAKGSRSAYAKMETGSGWKTQVEPGLADFIADIDSFYFGTANTAGQPYIQHRGGSAGFLKVLDEETLAFADFRGNRQYISLGNLAENNNAFIFLMNYPNRQRIKIWGRAHVVDDDPALLDSLTDPDYRGRPEQAIVFRISAWDANCPQHITPRYSEDQVKAVVEPLQSRIIELESRLQAVGGLVPPQTGG